MGQRGSAERLERSGRPAIHGSVPLGRALSKLGILSRAQADVAIRAGRVRVDGRVVDDPAHRVVPERAHIALDGEVRQKARWRTILLHKPRGIVTTRRDPDARMTVFDVLAGEGDGLNAVGRLDRATSGLLLLTTDTRLANWLTDPVNAVPRVYVVTVRGEVTDDRLARLGAGVTMRKSSRRESHLVVELHEGRNRQVRRMTARVGFPTLRLVRASIGRVALEGLAPGEWREVDSSSL